MLIFEYFSLAMIVAVTITSIIAFLARKERFVMFILAAAMIIDVIYHIEKVITHPLAMGSDL